MLESRVKQIPEPMDDWTIVKIAYEEMSDGGIVIPKSAYDDTPVGEVVAVGPGRLNEMTGLRMPMPWKPGDRVLMWGSFISLGKAPEEESRIEVPKLLIPGREAHEAPKLDHRLVAIRQQHIIAVTERAVEKAVA